MKETIKWVSISENSLNSSKLISSQTWQTSQKSIPLFRLRKSEFVHFDCLKWEVIQINRDICLNVMPNTLEFVSENTSQLWYISLSRISYKYQTIFQDLHICCGGLHIPLLYPLFGFYRLFNIWWNYWRDSKNHFNFSDSCFHPIFESFGMYLTGRQLKNFERQVFIWLFGDEIHINESIL